MCWHILLHGFTDFTVLIDCVIEYNLMCFLYLFAMRKTSGLLYVSELLPQQQATKANVEECWELLDHQLLEFLSLLYNILISSQ